MRNRLLAVVVSVLVIGAGHSAAAAPRYGKVVSDPMPKQAPVVTTTTEPPAPAPSPEPIPTTTTIAARDLVAECWQVVARLLPQHPQPANWSAPVCQTPDPAVRETFGRDPQGYVLWQPRTIHLQPTELGLDLEFLYLHEVGHAWCEHDHVANYAYRYSEECADQWAHARL